MGYSTKPTIVFAVSGIILAMFMSIGFLMFECCYAGFGKCHPNKPKKCMIPPLPFFSLPLFSLPYVLAMFMSIGFLMFECCYAGFGKCHPNKPKKSMPQGSMNVITCCLGHGGWHLGWIFSTALFPAILTSFLGIVLFEVIFITMPDIYR
eukprot:Phypoly_transcript_11782.p1 GENE.Phypoly_transcript_11782~~Phypoly_transcript_11782.p1  ORF type:complete len:150 (+),score=2.08 Phypoly_transcript_11782:213-662(+)